MNYWMAIGAIAALPLAAAEARLRGPQGGAGVDLVTTSPALTREITGTETGVTRSYRVNPDVVHGLRAPRSSTAESLQQVMESFVKMNGLEIMDESGASVFYNSRTGMLLLRASPQEHEKIQALLKTVTTSTPQVRVEMRVVESMGNLNNGAVPGGQGTVQKLTEIPGTERDNADESDPAGPGGEDHASPLRRVTVLTEGEMQTIIRFLEQREGFDLVSAPAVTTLSGREARLAVEDPAAVVTDPPLTAPGKAMKARWMKKDQGAGDEAK